MAGKTFKFNLVDKVKCNPYNQGELVGTVFECEESLQLKTRIKKNESPFINDEPLYTYGIIFEGLDTYSYVNNDAEIVTHWAYIKDISLPEDE